MGMSPDGEHVISAVMADLLEHVYLFEDGSYLDRVPIPHDPGHPAVHPTVKVLTHGDGNAVVLFADGLRFEGMETGLLATFDDHGVGSVAPLPLAALAEKHGGLRDVYVGGTELETGILVSGRSESGKPWSRVYVLTLVESRIEVESISSQKAWGCPYYASWRQGQDGRTLFGQVVSD